MKIKLGLLRKMIREFLLEAGGGTTVPLNRIVHNSPGADFRDREQLGKISKNTGENEISSHLQDPLYSEEDCWGPVPPTQENPYMVSDPYSKDYHVIPTPQIKR